MNARNAVVVWMLLIGTAAGASLVITSSGYWLLTVDANGIPSLSPFEEVIRLDGEPTPIPPPDPPTDTGTLTEKVARWSTAVNEPIVSGALGLMMEFAAQQGDQGNFNESFVHNGKAPFKDKSSMVEFTKEAIPGTLKAAGSQNVDGWNDMWTMRLWPEVVRIENAGKMDTLDDQVRVWREIAAGFKSVAGVQWELIFVQAADGIHQYLELKGEANPLLDKLLKLFLQLLLDFLGKNIPGLEA